MLTTMEAIEMRRSIRKYKPDLVPDDVLTSLFEAARLAPSGCNAQPWRFKVVKDNEIKRKMALAAYNQTFIEEAPVVLVCCADISGYLEGTVSGIEDLGRTGAVQTRITDIILQKTEMMKTLPMEQIAPRIACNVAIAVEHIVLRALDFGLGSCWVRLIDEPMIKSIFDWTDNIHVVCLLPLGYPAEEPVPRKRLELEEIVM
jgi:nitroreductase